MTADTTLYAAWARKANLVTGPVGTASPGSSVVYYYDADEFAYYNGSIDTAVEVSASANSGAGWTVLGWTKDPASTEAKYAPKFTLSSADLSSASEDWYAIGKRNLTLSYDANGATGDAPAAEGVKEQIYNASGQQTDRATDTFTVKGADGLTADGGRVFAGWNTEADGTGTMYQEDDSITVNEPTTLYAQWAYTVDYDANAGTAAVSGVPSQQLKFSDIPLELHTGKPSRNPDTANIETKFDLNYTGAPAVAPKETKRSEGWAFKGWTTRDTVGSKKGVVTSDEWGAVSEDVKYAPGDTYEANASATLYAQWEVQNPTYGSLALPTPDERDGYDFLGWFPEATDGEKVGEAGDTYTPEASGTLYAQWKAKTYEVSYDANGGTGAPDAQEKTHGQDLTLSDQAPTRDPVDKTVTLTLNYKGGAYSSGDDDNAFGETGHDSAVANVKTEYTFQGWGTSASATEAAYQPNGTYPANANADATLYAVWKADPSGFGTYKLPDATSTSATSVPYEFKGWTTAEHSSKNWDNIPTDARWEKGSQYGPVQADATLYAVWNPPTYAIEYDGNGNGDTVTDVPALQNKEADQAGFTLAADKPRRMLSDDNASFAVTFDANGGNVAVDGGTAAPTATKTLTNGTLYDFKGWADKANIGADGVVTDAQWVAYDGKKYEAGVPYADNADLKLYAQWTKTGEIGSVELPTPSRDGYTFNGWYTAATDGDKVEGDGEGKYTPSGDITLYAQWTPKTYTVKYDANAPSDKVTDMPSPLTFTKIQDAAATLSSAEPKRANESDDVVITYDVNGGVSAAAGGKDTSHYESTYGFLSWKKGNAVYAPSASYKEEGDATLKADWAEETTYSPVTLPNAAWEGHIFLGWFTEKTDGDEVGSAGDSYTPSSKEGVTLHAHWETVKYPVTYDGNTDDETLSSVPDSQEKEHGTDLTLSSTEPTRDSTVTDEFTVTFDRRGGTGSPESTTSSATIRHVFRGWTTVDTIGAAKGQVTDAEWSGYKGEKYPAGQSNTYTANAPATLYAQWQDVPSGAEVTLPDDPTPPDSGFTFKGWSLNKDTDPDDTTGALLSAGSKVYPHEDTTYYAIYNPPTYIVSYDVNGGTSDAPDDQVKAKGTDLQLSEDEPTRTVEPYSYRVYYDGNGGSATAEQSDELTAKPTYWFRGWAEEAAVSEGAEPGLPTDAEWAAYSKAHHPGDTYSTDADLDLFAQWEEKMESEPASVTLPAADRPGYEFLGWFDGDERVGGSGDAYEPNGQDTYLQAQWKPYEYPDDGEAFAYTVIFEYEDGTQIETQDFTFGESQALSAGPLDVPDGKVFACWKLRDGASTFSERQLVANLTNVADGKVYLVAQWKDAPNGGGTDPVDPTDPDNPNGYNYYTIEYYEQGADGDTYARKSADKVFANTDDEVAVPASAFEAPLGFHVDYEKTKDSGKVAEGGITKLEVYWARNQFDVRFLPGATDATGQMGDQHFVWASGDKLSPNAFKRSGYTFTGWRVTERDAAELQAQAADGLSAQSFGDVALFVQALGDLGTSVADRADGSRLTSTDQPVGHVTLTAQWKADASNPTGPTGPTDPTDPDGPDNPDNPDNPDDPDNPNGPDNPDDPDKPKKDPKEELAELIKEAEGLIDPDRGPDGIIDPNRPDLTDDEKKLLDEIEAARKVLDDPDATEAQVRDAIDRLADAIAAFKASRDGDASGGAASKAGRTRGASGGAPNTGDPMMMLVFGLGAMALIAAAALALSRRMAPAPVAKRPTLRRVERGRHVRR